MSIKILIADDQQLTREGIRSLLEREPDMDVLGEAEDGRSAVRMARELGPDVILMDVCMPEMNGIVATTLILAEAPRIKVIALSMLDDRRFVSNMLRAGASGYLIKDCSFKELARAIRRVVANKIYLSPGIMDVVVKDYVKPPAYSDSAYSSQFNYQGKGSVTAGRRRAFYHSNCQQFTCKREDHRIPSAKPYDENKCERHRRTHQICHSGGIDICMN